MHYIDEGPRNAPVLVFVHGLPTWSFLFRDLISALSPTFRCIAPDHIGFGLSDKPAQGLLPEVHADNLGILLSAMGVDDHSLVVHGFGSPIGLGAALNRPSHLKGLVVFNSWLWPVQDDPAVNRLARFLNSPVFDILLKTMNPSRLLPFLFASRSHLTAEALNHYVGPFQESDSRAGLVALAHALTSESQWMYNLQRRLEEVHDLPSLICWGMQDRNFGSGNLQRWRMLLPKSSVMEIPDSGHFVPEEASSSAIVPRIRAAFGA